jgi:hypothetical protein
MTSCDSCGKTVKAKAKGCILIILDGEKGSGFSCQADPLTTLQLPEILEGMAKDIRATFKRGQI